ncbi:unnamed protein product [[Candida] boidinii]|nr:unnamed protein product [[Candida] boidinii]
MLQLTKNQIYMDMVIQIHLVNVADIIKIEELEINNNNNKFNNNYNNNNHPILQVNKLEQVNKLHNKVKVV